MALTRPPSHGRSGAAVREPLSKREREVMALVVRGLTNPQIGRELYLSKNTVKVYLRAAFRKLGVSNRVQAAVKFYRMENGHEQNKSISN